MTAPECYRVLGLPSGADMERVKGAYRALAKKLHPDASGSARTGEEFQRIRSAYEILLAREKLRVPQSARRSSARREAAPIDLAAVGHQAVEGRTPALRLLAVRSLERSGKRSAYGYLRQVLYDTEEKVVIAAVRAIGTIGVEQSAGELAALFTRSKAEVKRAILSAAEQMELRGRMMSLAVAGMEDSDGSIRREARRLYTKYKRIE